MAWNYESLMMCHPTGWSYTLVQLNHIPRRKDVLFYQIELEAGDLPRLKTARSMIGESWRQLSDSA